MNALRSVSVSSRDAHIIIIIITEWRGCVALDARRERSCERVEKLVRHACKEQHLQPADGRREPTKKTMNRVWVSVSIVAGPPCLQFG